MKLNEHPRLALVPHDLAASLEKIGIKTDVDLLFGPEPLEIIRRLPPGAITLKDLNALITQISEATCAQGTSASRLSTSSSYLSSHCSDLDQMLGGSGFSAQSVYEMSGDHKAGKSILALNVALHSLLDDSRSEVVWIDTTGDFSPDLAAAVVESERFPTTVLQRHLLFYCGG
ncbi:hypothetical protein PQX77_016802 [Marasmius sp. AFHP31]|nr:hypothetical protein PQX77_016802 [Marasmius sp. AFHP31]